MERNEIMKCACGAPLDPLNWRVECRRCERRRKGLEDNPPMGCIVAIVFVIAVVPIVFGVLKFAALMKYVFK